MTHMKIKIPDDVMFRVLGDEAVLLNLATGTYFGLDDVGTRMWQLISEHGSMDKVIEIMLDEYEVEERQLRDDLAKLINQLSEKGLVKADAEEASQAG
jgi:predicted RND superfamily exporter protein